MRNKRVLALLLVLCLILTLCGCSRRTSFAPSVPGLDDFVNNTPPTSDPSDTPSQPDSTNNAGSVADEIAALWDQIYGVWLSDTGESSTFLLFGSDMDGLLFLMGEASSSAALGEFMRPVDLVQDADGDYLLTVADSAGEYTVLLNTTDSANGSLTLVRFDNSLWNASFFYAAESLDQVIAGPAEQTSFDPNEVLPALEGVWLCKEDGIWYFAQFQKIPNSWQLTVGIPYSDYFFFGELTGIHSKSDENSFNLSFLFPAVEPSEISDGSPAFSADLSVDPSLANTGIARITNLAGSGEVREFSYAGATLEDVTLESLQ